MADDQSFEAVTTVEPERRIFPLFDPRWAGKVFSRGPVGETTAQVVVQETVLDELVAEARRSPRAEVGGVLVGGYYEYNSIRFVTVDGWIPARLAESERLAVHFTHDAWAAVERERERRFPTKRMVGWYHTHPRSGIYFSGRDTFAHRSFFSLPWQTALVIDPSTGDLGFFSWRGDEVVPTGYYYLTDRLVIE